MALTLEAALVLPLSISLIFSLIPRSTQTYRQAATEVISMKQAVRLSTDPPSLYVFVSINNGLAGKTSGDLSAGTTGDQSGKSRSDVLMTSPKLMFCLVTAIIDDLKMFGLAKP